jgi:hypothetical protein
METPLQFYRGILDNSDAVSQDFPPSRIRHQQLKRGTPFALIGAAGFLAAPIGRGFVAALDWAGCRGEVRWESVETRPDCPAVRGHEALQE